MIHEAYYAAYVGDHLAFDVVERFLSAGVAQ
jgi:hypothetical protein